MFGVRLIGVVTAYSVVLLEIYSGAINGPKWWVFPGALVIALLLSISLFGVSDVKAPAQPAGFASTAVQWILILGLSVGMAFFANYFGRELLPNLDQMP